MRRRPGNRRAGRPPRGGPPRPRPRCAAWPRPGHPRATPRRPRPRRAIDSRAAPPRAPRRRPRPPRGDGSGGAPAGGARPPRPETATVESDPPFPSSEVTPRHDVIATERTPFFHIEEISGPSDTIPALPSHGG